MKKVVLILLSITILLFLVSFLEAKSVEYSTMATVTVNPIYELSLEIDVITETILSGDNLSILINLSKEDLTTIAKEIKVDLNYEILRSKVNLITSGYAGSVNVTNEIEITIQIPTPYDLGPGRYILRITASHPQAYGDESEDAFKVKRKI